MVEPAFPNPDTDVSAAKAFGGVNVNVDDADQLAEGPRDAVQTTILY